MQRPPSRPHGADKKHERAEKQHARADPAEIGCPCPSPSHLASRLVSLAARHDPRPRQRHPIPGCCVSPWLAAVVCVQQCARGGNDNISGRRGATAAPHKQARGSASAAFLVASLSLCISASLTMRGGAVGPVLFPPPQTPPPPPPRCPPVCPQCLCVHHLPSTCLPTYLPIPSVARRPSPVTCHLSPFQRRSLARPRRLPGQACLSSCRPAPPRVLLAASRIRTSASPVDSLSVAVLPPHPLQLRQCNHQTAHHLVHTISQPRHALSLDLQMPSLGPAHSLRPMRRVRESRNRCA